MTSKRLAAILRELTPTPFSDATLLMWLSNCENSILTDVMLAAPEDCTELEELSDAKLLVPHPWDKLYLPYLQAQVAHANGEYDHYANFLALYNAYRDEYARYILESVHPADGMSVTDRYYLSAYAIAVEHGYAGTEEAWLESLRGKKGDPFVYEDFTEEQLAALVGPTGETSLPIAWQYNGSSTAYTARGADLPAVVSGSQHMYEGKGKQIIFIPLTQNSTTAPTLAINDGDPIPIRLRAPRNQGKNDETPDATLPVPIGALMKGVPYTMTFCGLFWLIDSQIAEFDPSQMDMMRRFADQAIALTDRGTIGVPVINSYDGITGDMATAKIKRSAAEEAAPPEDGSVTIPTVMRVIEMIEQADTSTDIAGKWENVETVAPTKEADGYMVAEKGSVNMELPIPKELATVAYVDGKTAEMQSRKDVTAEYAAWTPNPKRATGGPSSELVKPDKTVADFVKTLSDGQYSLTDDYNNLWHVDVLTANGYQWRLLREYTDEYCYFTAYCDETLAFAADSENGLVSAGGRTMLTDFDIPIPTVADAGKVLTVSDNGWAQWTAVANAEEVAV